MMHVGLGREHPLHVEYIHIGATLALIQDVFIEAILSHPKLHLQRKIAIIKALSKVIWIQNDLFAKWYVRDGEEYAGEADGVVVEKEGYLRGKKILDEDDEEGIDKQEKQPRDAGVCPFTGISKGMESLHVHAGEAQNATETGDSLHTPA